MAYLQRQLGAPLADYGRFGAPLAYYGLGAPKKKKKKSFLKRVAKKAGRVAKKVGKVALKAAPVVAGLTLGPAGGIVVGAASGAIGRGRPKLKRILRGAAIGGATGLIRTGQAGKILVKGGKAALKLAKGGGRIIGKIGKGAGGVIERIAGGDIGPTEGAVIGAGAGAVYEGIRRRRKRPPRPEVQMPDEPLTPDELPPPPPINGHLPPPIEAVQTAPEPQAAPAPGESPPSPFETPTAGQIPTAGGLVPGPATNALMPGAGGEQFAPAATEEVVPDETPKPNTALLLAAGVAVVVLLASKKKGRRR